MVYNTLCDQLGGCRSHKINFDQRFLKYRRMSIIQIEIEWNEGGVLRDYKTLIGAVIRKPHYQSVLLPRWRIKPILNLFSTVSVNMIINQKCCVNISFAESVVAE